MNHQGQATEKTERTTGSGNGAEREEVSSVSQFMARLESKNRGETNFLESVEEVIASVWELLGDRKAYREAKILERMTEPERVIQFRVPWVDDRGCVQVNRGYRVEFSSTLGPYKGGLRFHPSVNLDVVKFLGFEQIFKNSLTTLPMGGAKGGSDFSSRGRSEQEVMRFCQSFMSELYRHIGERTDVPAGDIGVGIREIGYLFGQYKRLTNRFEGALTGKGLEWGGSPIRSEATGYGVVYFALEMLKRIGESLEAKRVAISGSGNVAQYAAEKLIDEGALVVTLSDSGGTVILPDGMSREQLQWVMELKNVRRGTLEEFAGEYGLEYMQGKRPWGVECDLAFPCATENEIDEGDARMLVGNGCMGVVEGANKPSTPAAIDHFLENAILYAPGKAANAGGVAVSGLEMSQNGMHTQWSREEVDDQLQKLMRRIHESCVEFGNNGKSVDYLKGANVAGFIRVADAMLKQGVV